MVAHLCGRGLGCFLLDTHRGGRRFPFHLGNFGILGLLQLIELCPQGHALLLGGDLGRFNLGDLCLQCSF